MGVYTIPPTQISKNGKKGRKLGRKGRGRGLEGRERWRKGWRGYIFPASHLPPGTTPAVLYPTTLALEMLLEGHMEDDNKKKEDKKEKKLEEGIEGSLPIAGNPEMLSSPLYQFLSTLG